MSEEVYRELQGRHIRRRRDDDFPGHITAILDQKYQTLPRPQGNRAIADRSPPENSAAAELSPSIMSEGTAAAQIGRTQQRVPISARRCEKRSNARMWTIAAISSNSANIESR